MIGIGDVVLGRYRVEGELGSGGMGRIYRARHVELEQAVALKVLSIEATPELLGRFKREARLMARIRHPNVVSVLDYGALEDNRPCIAMELVEGDSLHELVNSHGALPWHQATALMLGVLDGLQAVHDNGILHRDLKPGNVLVVSVDPPLAKLIDFGISKPTDPSATRYTQQGRILGTPAYMSPEQLNAEEIDARADVYAAGLLLHVLLGGRHPWPGRGFPAAMKRLTEPCPPPVPPQHLPPVPEALAVFLLASLRREREERPPTARAFADLLTAVLDEPAADGRATTPGVARRVTTPRLSFQPGLGGVQEATIEAIKREIEGFEASTAPTRPQR